MHFEEVDIEPDAAREISGTDVGVVVRPGSGAEGEPMRVPVHRGERFGGMTHAEMLERGAGPVRLPAPNP